ncbi:Uncharacterised protein [Klebsiella variicola]|nr:Uncharacterised protein [Klebsiella variicola]
MMLPMSVASGMAKLLPPPLTNDCPTRNQYVSFFSLAARGTGNLTWLCRFAAYAAPVLSSRLITCFSVSAPATCSLLLVFPFPGYSKSPSGFMSSDTRPCLSSTSSPSFSRKVSPSAPNLPPEIIENRSTSRVTPGDLTTIAGTSRVFPFSSAETSPCLSSTEIPEPSSVL